MKMVVSQRTGGALDSEQWTVPVRCAPDCPVRHLNSLRREADNGHSRAVAPDCPVCTRLSSNGRIQRSTATDPNGRLTWQSTGQWTVFARCAPDCPVHPSIESCCFCPTTIIVGEAVNTPQLAIWGCGSPSNILRHSIDFSKCSYTQVLNRITRWLA
jgi:hypothetical protein